MKTHTHTIKAVEGLHARPAGLLVKLAGKCRSKITIHKDGESVDARRIMAVLSLNIKQGENVSFRVEGEDEDDTLLEIMHICNEML